MAYNAQLFARRSKLVRVIRLQATPRQAILIYFQPRLLRVCSLRAACGLMTTSFGTDQLPIFRHAPLDHTQASIRLIEITPGLSAEGLISCGVSHATTETEYVCLSYRWGDEDPNTSKNILLDGNLFTIRQNLHDFLHLASTDPEWSRFTQKKYWIDALCINQSNKRERNHQVAQMGEIFASARRVHIWLGRTSNVHRMSALLSSSSSDGRKDAGILELQTDLDLIGRYVLHNEYWNRAWVVQEIVLARSVVVSLDVTTLSLRRFCRRIDRLRLDITQTPFQQFEICHDQDPLQSLRNTSLLSLLGRFRDKDCAVPRDRVFSLLAMCHPEEQIGVDYGSPWVDILVKIFAKTRHIPCICSAALLARSLMPPSRSRPDDTIPYAEPMLTFEIADVFLNNIDLLLETYIRPNASHSEWRAVRPDTDFKTHKLGHRACLWYVLLILRNNINGRAIPAFFPDRVSSLPALEYQCSLKDILEDLPEYTSTDSKGKKIPPGFVKLFHVFLESSYRKVHSHRFQRMDTTLNLFNLSPGWYMSKRDSRIETVTVYVSLSALGKASEGMALCGWQGDMNCLTEDDMLFRQFSVYYPPEDREGEYT